MEGYRGYLPRPDPSDRQLSVSVVPVATDVEDHDSCIGLRAAFDDVILHGVVSATSCRTRSCIWGNYDILPTI
eukprot:6205966-Pleurochrysis_carterae.AAC.2